MRHPQGMILGFMLIVAAAATAGAPVTSIRPKPRDQMVTMATRTEPPIVRYNAEIRPKPRVEAGLSPALAAHLGLEEVERESEAGLATTRPVYRSPRPAVRPVGLGLPVRTLPTRETRVRVASTEPRAGVRTTGALCGDTRIRGEKIASIKGKIAGCGVTDPVRVISVAGISLSQQAIMDCETARTLADWVSSSAIPTFRGRGGGLDELKVAAHYSCRTRNSQPGAKISEHGKGHAIDISGFTLADGTMITVEEGWSSRRDRRVLERLHASACGPFGTVLGPNSDKFHKDHFHFDTARYRSGSYCR
jgi:hypothetical protein